ncbi:MAG: mucin desulfatase, partial [Lachnospiraceae bacterium]|nr:mucin desulfatase [Lachnospiraceae bacterium]
PLGAMMMTLENAIRILGDYIAGDVYYSISYPDQNLYRARTQIKLLREYDRCRGELEDIILSHHRS